jgi:uncharacterized protein YidB (DUF937 family)
MTNLISRIFGGGTDTSALLMVLQETLGGDGTSSGLTSLLEKFDMAGLGDKAESWVGGGPNEPVTGAEVKRALGDQEMERIAHKAGMPVDKAADGLASVLPDTVDKLTPGGKIPDPSEFGEHLKKIPRL